jgi:hypothetical protein
MLSPGRWGEQVPRDPLENLRFRRFIRDKARRDKGLQRHLRECCTHDVLFYINTFAFTYNPRLTRKVWPFATFPYQDAAIAQILDCIENQKDLVILKSREMGASWLCMTVMDWLWLFHLRQKFLAVRRVGALVDDPGNPDSLFWKIDFVHSHLPTWILDPDQVKRKRLSFVNLDNGSTINGEATTGAAGVGGRATAMFVDEFSRIPEAAELFASTADTTGSRIFAYTYTDNANAAYTLGQRTDVVKLRLHWSEHPHKNKGLYQYDGEKKQVVVLDNGYEFSPDCEFVTDGKLRSPWYDAECVRRANPRDVAMNLDIDPQGSMYQFFDRQLIASYAAKHRVRPTLEGDLEFDRDTGQPLVFVPAKGGPIKLWVALDAYGRPPRKHYTAGADCSAGVGSTNSCLSLCDAETKEKVLEFATPFLAPPDFAAKCVALCRWFEDRCGQGARFAWEAQGPGVPFGLKVTELGYRNVYMRTNEFSYLKKCQDVPGWVPTPANKRALLEDYRAALGTGVFVNHSREAIEECLNFVHMPNGSIEHAGTHGCQDPTGARVNHGDRVIADALAWKMAKEVGTVQQNKPETSEPPMLSLAWRRRYHEEKKQRERDPYNW